MPSWMFSGHDSLLAIDIGGTNMRAGLVALNARKAPDLSRAEVFKSSLWRHRDGDEQGPSREEAIARLVTMIEDLIAKAQSEGMKLAPFIGVGSRASSGRTAASCAADRTYPAGTGNRAASISRIASARRSRRSPDTRLLVLLHNDAVVQGLSEVPFMQDVERWGVLTIGTGLGNARFTNRNHAEDDADLTAPAALPLAPVGDDHLMGRFLGEGLCRPGGGDVGRCAQEFGRAAVGILFNPSHRPLRVMRERDLDVDRLDRMGVRRLESELKAHRDDFRGIGIHLYHLCLAERETVELHRCCSRRPLAASGQGGTDRGCPASLHCGRQKVQRLEP